MEDYLSVKLAPNEDLRKIPELREQAYVAVFDGHGGKEAAKYARERLWDTIQSQPKFQLSDAESICEGIRDAFEGLHEEMLQHRGTWKPNKMGDPSTAGTTASAVIFRQDKIFVANVGDSTAVLAVNNPYGHMPEEPAVLAQVLTKDHKPDDPSETQLIESLGGHVVMSKKGVPRVVWERQRQRSRAGTELEQDKHTDSIPFLSVSRSLGDFWSYNPRTQKYTVSPSPDVTVVPLNLSEQKFVVIASDGLWNVMTPHEVVSFIWDYEHDTLCQEESKDVVRALINEALRRWKSKGLLADNIAVLIAFLSEQPPPQSTQDAATLDSKEATPLIEDALPDVRLLQSATPPPPEQQKVPAIVERQSFSRSGSHYYYKETLADGGTIEYDTKIKLRGRKHKSRDSRVSRRTGSKRTRSGEEGEEEVEDTREEVGEAKEGEEEELVVPQLKRSRRMSPSLLAITEEGHVSDSSSSGVYSDGFSPDGVKEPVGGLFGVKELAGSSGSHHGVLQKEGIN
ncbi:hypothetical protein EMCRGX_G023866 [Ephydatia muelleri]